MRNKLFKLFSSNIKIKVSGKNINNFIKRLIKNNINLIRVIPVSYREVELIINYNDLDKIYKYKTIYDIEIIRYYGKIRLLKLFKKNIFIISFLLLGIILIYILSNVIFNIEVIHSNNDIIKLVNEELYNNGIRKYTFVKSYDEIEKIEDKILNDNKDNLEWLEIIREGTKYTVRVEERIINKEIIDNKNYDVIASKNAIIKCITAESGEKVKEINSYVEKGDIIISSYVNRPNNEKVQMTAKGNVIGETWYNVSIEYPYIYNEVIYTGKKKEVYSFNVINKRIGLFDFKKYKSFNKDIKYIFYNNFIPVYFAKEYQYETRVVNNIYTYDEVKEKAINLAKKKLMDKYSGILNVNDIIVVSENDNNSKLELNLFITCDEDITEYKESIIEENTET